MSFTLTCKSCNIELEAEKKMLGLKLNCPNCNKTIMVEKPQASIKYPCTSSIFVFFTLGILQGIMTLGTADSINRGITILGMFSIVLTILSIIAAIGFFKRGKFAFNFGLAYLIGSALFLAAGYFGSFFDFRDSAMQIVCLVFITFYIFGLLAISRFHEWYEKVNK